VFLPTPPSLLRVRLLLAFDQDISKTFSQEAAKLAERRRLVGYLCFLL
jgi:hypothetical protein